MLFSKRSRSLRYVSLKTPPCYTNLVLKNFLVKIENFLCLAQKYGTNCRGQYVNYTPLVSLNLNLNLTFLLNFNASYLTVLNFNCCCWLKHREIVMFYKTSYTHTAQTHTQLPTTDTIYFACQQHQHLDVIERSSCNSTSNHVHQATVSRNHHKLFRESSLLRYPYRVINSGL